MLLTVAGSYIIYRILRTGHFAGREHSGE
jgi:hypothetical protein